jgi:hypothetical protein
MFNKQVLSRITSALNSAKAPAKKKDIIVDPRGQWDHPGQPTRIPANEITMRGVPYPVMAYPDNGQPQLMYPDQEYSFPGAKYVDEYPQMNRMRNGGTLPQAQKGITISDPQEYAYRKSMYDDSLSLYNQGIKDRDNYVNYLYKNGYDVKNHLERWNTNGWVDTDKHPTIGAIYNGILENSGGGFDRDSKGNPHDFTFYPHKTKPERKVYDESPEGKLLGKRYSVYKKPVQQVYKSGKEPIKKYPDIYVTDPNDPRIGQYNEAGNKYVLDVSKYKEAEILERKPLPEIGRLPNRIPVRETPEIVPQDFKYTPKKQEAIEVANRSQTVMEADPDRPGKYKVKEMRQVPYAAKFPGEGTWEPANAPRIIYVDAEGNETEEKPGFIKKKQGGTNKVVNAYSKHFQPGGEQETRLPKRIVNRYPGMQNVYGSEGENLNVIKDPNYAASDYGFGDIEFIHPGSGHVQYSDDYDYQSPTPDKYTAVYNPKGANKHDVFLDTMHGMRDDPEYMKLLDKFSAETKKARGTSMDHWYEVDSEKDPYLVGDGREQWDKNFIDGVLRSHLAKKGMGRHSSDVKGYKMEREESTPEMYKATDDIYKYLKGKFKKGGFQNDLNKNRKVFEDWTYGKDLGMTYLPKAQNGITISDPKEYAYRNKMYTDSLNLYNAYKMQDKLMGLYSGTSKDKYKWNTAELKKGRKKNMVPGISYPIADDYQNEKEQFKDGFNLSARPQDLKLIKYYKSLGFTDKDIMYHSSPDVVSDKIRAVGTYNDGTAASPIYRKPKQKVTFGPNNVLPVEEKLELKTKPLQFIDTNRDIQDIVPNADYLKQYLQTRSANAIVPPASTLKWVQHPQTGTWYQIERPKNTMLTPEYNIRTGSYKKQ